MPTMKDDSRSELILLEEDEAMEGTSDTEPDRTVSESIIPKRRRDNAEPSVLGNCTQSRV